jgi:hypothetical protein
LDAIGPAAVASPRMTLAYRLWPDRMMACSAPMNLTRMVRGSG